MRRELVITFFVLGLIALDRTAAADGMQADGWPPKWEISQPEFAAFQMAIARLQEISPTTPVTDYRVVFLDKQYEYLFLFLHKNRDQVSIRGCGLPDMPAWEIGVSKDATRITRALCPK